MIDVTVEALQTVKSALTTFQTDIEGIAQRTSNCSDSIMRECKEHINQTKTEISQSEVEIATLNKQIEDYENQINQATNEYNRLIARIPKIQDEIRSLGIQISSLNSQISSLRAQLANVEDDDLRQQIEDQINALTRQVYQCETQQDQLENELQNSEKKKDELQHSINTGKSQKAQCENELSTQKNRCNKLKSKLERLSSSFSRVESNLREYVAATKKFESISSDSIESKSNTIDCCMESIEEYLNISIGSGGSHRSLSAREQLSNYMNSHNYGSDDYSTYSQDPEWQSLHEQVYGTSQGSPHELPDSDNHFCGLPIQRLENGTWGVISSCQEAYDEYSNNFNDYTYETFDAVETRVIDAREIAGIDMISDQDINNPQLFWGRSGGTYESFEAIVRMIPEVQERLNSGDNLSEIMLDDRLGACAGLFFNTSSADHPTVYIGDGFYELSGGGRHRVMLAQRLGLSFPVRIRGRIVHR